MTDGSRPSGPARVPPHNLQAEESVLGAMLLSRDAIADVVEILDPDHFYKPAHGHLYDAVMSLYSSGEPVDAVTVADELKRAGLLDEIGGPEVLLDLQATTPAISNAAHYARIVEEHALLRRMISVCNEIAETAYGVPEDVETAVDDAEARMFDVAQRRVSDTTAPIRDLLPANLDRIEMLYDRGEAITGLSTGYLDLDEKLAGLQPNALYVVGARPAMGKTSFALGLASHSAMNDDKPVLIFTLEMGQLELSQRLLCSEALVDAGRVKTGRLEEGEWSRISHAVGRLAEAPIFIDDYPHTSVMDIRAKSRRLKSRHGELGMVVIDYIQLMTGRSNAESRQVEVSEISRNLKILARELEVPVVALAQLNRGLEQRTDKRPMLSDLRESGCMPASTRIARADGSEVTMGDLLLSQETPMVWAIDDRGRLGARRLVKTFGSGIKPVYRLRLASGREVDATANHRFLTIGGWARLDELSVGGAVATPRVEPEPSEPVAWPDPEVVLLAQLLGDGSVVEAGGKRPCEHHIPTDVHRLPNDQIRLFLHHLWATGGSITISCNGRGPTVECSYSTTSEPMARGVQRLLLRLGIGTTISSSSDAGHRPAHHVRVWSHADLLRFATTVGCHGERGSVLPEAIRILESTTPTPNLDPIPHRVAESDIFWDEIVSIEPLGEQPVFDCTVEGDHNFVANGIIAHNSLEQDADVVLFLYRDEVYDEASPDKGVAEVIIAKHRNGPTGKVRLAFRGQYTRFDNMARSTPDGGGSGADPGEF